MVQWLRLHASTARGTGLTPGQGSNISHATQCSNEKDSLFHVSLPFQYFLLQTFLGTVCHSISPGAKDGDGNPKKPLGFSLSYHMEKNFIVNEGVSKSKHVPESQSLAFKVLWA